MTAAILIFVLIVIFMCIIFFVLYIIGYCYSGDNMGPSSDNKAIELRNELKKAASDLAVFRLEAAKCKLKSLESDYGKFELLKKDDVITFHLSYSDCLFLKGSKNIGIIYIHDQIFTEAECKELYVLSSPLYKLNKGTPLYNIVINRVDAYYQNQIEAVNKKLKNS